MPSTTSDHSSTSRRQSSRRAILKSFATGAAGAAFLAAGWAVEAAPRAALETGSAPVVRNPAKIVVVFGHPEDTEIFEGYYRTVHLPLARAMPKCVSLESALAVSEAVGEKAAFYRIATMTFNSDADLAACVGSAAGQAALADVANFATGGASATIVRDIQAYQLGAAEASGSEIAIPKRYEQRLAE